MNLPQSLPLDSVHILIGIALGILVAMIVLLVLQLRNSTQMNKLTYPAYEFTIKKAQAEADEILNVARTQARDIITKAELQGQEVFGRHTEATEAGLSEYLASFNSMKEETTRNLSLVMKEAEEASREISAHLIDNLKGKDDEVTRRIGEFIEGLNEIPKHIQAESVRALDGLHAKVAEAGEEVKQALMRSHEENREHVQAFLEEKFIEAEKGVEDYARSKKMLVDRNIESIVKEVTKITLKKALPASEHALLVKEALREVKNTRTL